MHLTPLVRPFDHLLGCRESGSHDPCHERDHSNGAPGKRVDNIAENRTILIHIILQPA